MEMPDPPPTDLVREAQEKMQELVYDLDAEFTQEDLVSFKIAWRAITETPAILSKRVRYNFIVWRRQLKEIALFRRNEPEWIDLAAALEINLQPTSMLETSDEIDAAIAAMCLEKFIVWRFNEWRPRHSARWSTGEIERIRSVVYTYDQFPDRFTLIQAEQTQQLSNQLQSLLTFDNVEWRIAIDSMDLEFDDPILEAYIDI
jgi:hypothetical protein